MYIELAKLSWRNWLLHLTATALETVDSFRYFEARNRFIEIRDVKKSARLFSYGFSHGWVGMPQ